MKTVSAVLLLFSLVAFSLVSTELFSQQGGIRGKVIDDDDNPLEGVEVVIQAKRGANRATVRTDAKGQFLRLGLQPGTYQIDFTLEGYEPAYAEVTISSGQAYRIDGIPLAKKPEGVLDPETHAQARAALDIAGKATAAGDYQAALDALLKFNELVPDASPEVLFNIGRSYEKLGNTEQALAHYEKAVELEPIFDAYVAMADIHATASRWSEAKAALEKARELKPGDQVVLFNYAVYAMNDGDPATAEEVFAKLVELKPDDALVHYQLGMVKASLGKNDEAAQHMEKYLELDPEGNHAATAKQILDTLTKNEA